MAIIAGEYNFTVQRRADHDENITLTDGSDNPINLTGQSIASQVWDESRSTKYADFSVSIPTPTNGSFVLSLTRAQTETFTPNILNYDVKIQNPSGKQEYYVEGTIFVSQGYTTM